MNKIKILALGDTPTGMTGFSDVTRQILTPWTERGAEVHIFALGFNGRDHWKYPQFRLINATPDAHTPFYKQFGGLLQLLAAGDYTHVWLNNDLNVFTQTDFPGKLRHVCALKKVRSMIYFPVDASLNRDWCDIIQRVDVAVTYTDYGYRQVREAGCTTPLHILGHGVDAAFFNPESPDRKALLRDYVRVTRGGQNEVVFTPDDFLLVNVNKNEWRKDPFRSLEILAGLREAGVPAKLILRMAPMSDMNGVHLEDAGHQLGLKVDHDFSHMVAVNRETLRQLYHAADLYLTTTLGEGWGLGITEALACGCPVALPRNTACLEIGDEIQKETPNRITCLPGETDLVCGPMDSRVRRRVSVGSAVVAIKKFYESGEWRNRYELTVRQKEWLSWPRLSDAMWKLLVGRERVASGLSPIGAGIQE